jgi:hypothetical protein
LSLTLPTVFEAVKFQNVGTMAFMVKITNNSGTVFRFGDRTMNENPLVSSPHGDFIEGLIYDMSGVTHGYDFNTLEYQPARVSVVLSNLWSKVKLDSYTWQRASDRLPNGSALGLWGQSIQVWMYPGAYSQSPDDDGLLVFDGSIVQIDIDSDGKLILQADEIWNTGHRMLPQRRADVATFTDLPVENVGITLPLVYGPHNEQAYLRNTGFAVGLRVAQWKWVIADHVVDSFYDEPRPSAATDGTSYGSSSTKAVWVKIDELNSWARSYAGVTFNTNDSGRATVVVDPLTVGFDVYLYPGSGQSASSATDAGNTAGITAAFDYDSSTKFSIIANSTTAASIYFEWYQNGSDATSGTNNGIADLNGPGTDLEGVNLYMSKPGGTTIDSSSIEVWDGGAWVTVATSIDVATANMIHYQFAPAFGWGTSLQWHLGSGANGGDGTPFKVRLSFVGTGWTANTTVAAYVHEIRLVKSCSLPKTIVTVGPNPNQRSVSPKGWIRWTDYGWASDWLDPNGFAIPSVLGASVTGREHADEADHTGEAWNDGDQITNPAGVIWSLLVQELGFDTGDDIDTDSFVVVYNSATSRNCVLNLRPGSQVFSKDLIDNICYEQDLILYRRRGATPKFALAEGDGRAALAATIRRSEIRDLPTVSVTPFNINNIITFRYRRLPHDNQFFKSETVEDTTSTAEYGDFSEEIFCQTIANSTWLTPIKNRLISSRYFRSRAHYVVEFTTIGCRYAALELGDRIQFDATSMDAVLLCYGETWASLDFIVYEASVMKDGFSFKAVSKLHADI